jgi:carbon-monoxide dehydrogenase iron sulfur subunit
MKLILDTEKCTGCKICELACSAKHQGVFNPRKAHLRIINKYTQTGREKEFKTCVLCMNCLEGCLVGAITFNGKWLVVDDSVCTGCSQCVDSCPEGVIYLNGNGIASVPDFCEGTPLCVEWCPRQAIRQEEVIS